jgi:hypothetical protein
MISLILLSIFIILGIVLDFWFFVKRNQKELKVILIDFLKNPENSNLKTFWVFYIFFKTLIFYLSIWLFIILIYKYNIIEYNLVYTGTISFIKDRLVYTIIFYEKNKDNT